MHSIAFVAILFLSPASAAPALTPALNACPNIDPVAIGVSSPVKAPRLKGNWHEMLIPRPGQKPKKMTCDQWCADDCWLAQTNCNIACGNDNQPCWDACLVGYQQCICENQCCTPDDLPAYCQ